MFRNLSSARVPTAAQARFWLVVFSVRHGIGVALFVTLTAACFRMNAAPIGWMLLLLTPVYAAFAFVSGRKLLVRFRAARSQAAAAAAANNGDARRAR